MAIRLLVLVGGAVGFTAGVVLAWLNHCQAAESFWRASVVALATGVLMRWWGHVWVQSLQQSLAQRKAEVAAASKEAKPGHTRKP